MNTKTLAMVVLLAGAGTGLAYAQSSTGTNTTGTTTTMTPATGSMSFIAKADKGDWRASKLVGVSIYGPDDKSIGKVSDVVMGHDGSVKAVVISVGGFVGIGSKNVGVPFTAVKWQDQPKAPMPSNSTETSTGMSGTASPAQPGTGAPATANAPQAPADYPDHGVLNLTEDQLKQAPTFTYASEQS